MCVCVLRARLLSSAQHRRSLSDTWACLYGTTADTRCVFTSSPAVGSSGRSRLQQAPAAQLPDWPVCCPSWRRRCSFLFRPSVPDHTPGESFIRCSLKSSCLQTLSYRSCWGFVSTLQTIKHLQLLRRRLGFAFKAKCWDFRAEMFGFASET